MKPEKTYNFKIKDKNNIEWNVAVNIKTAYSRRDFETLEYISASTTISISAYNEDAAGQVHDLIAPADEKQKRLIEIWKRYHLNDLKAGTKRQTEYLKSVTSNLNNPNISYQERVELLKKADLYIDRGYKYGSDWLIEVIPDDVVKELIDLSEAFVKESRYEH